MVFVSKSAKKIASFNRNLIFFNTLFNILGFSLIVSNLKSYNFNLMVLLIAFLINIIFTNFLIPKITKGDSVFILIVNMIYSIGTIIILRINQITGFYHIIWYFIGIIFMLFVFYFLKSTINFFRDKFYLFAFFTFFTFLITLVFGFSAGGAKNWIRIANGVTIQPSEFAKISYIFMIAAFYNNYDNYKDLKRYLLMLFTYIFIGMFVLQGELGTAMIFFALFITSTFVFERRYVYMIINLILAFVGLYFAYKLFSHIRVRFDIWLNPWQDPYGRGYQNIQSLIGIASGGMFGTGIGLGKPNFIPVSTSDFIASAVMEEMGIFMGISILLLYIIFTYKSFKISFINRDIYYSSISFSIGLMIAFQSLIMFGGILGLIPLTGITTPFLSYGGSSTISNFMLLGALLYVSTDNKKVYYEK